MLHDNFVIMVLCYGSSDYIFKLRLFVTGMGGSVQEYGSVRLTETDGN